MSRIWLAACSMVTPMGIGTGRNYEEMRAGRSGLKWIDRSSLLPQSFVGGLIEDQALYARASRLESMCIEAIDDIRAQGFDDFSNTLLILSSTKGNISLLGSSHIDPLRIGLTSSSEFLKKFFGFKKAIVLSNACISGLLSVLVAQRTMLWQEWEQVLVVGADELSKFILSGFQSLQALSDTFCRPFDANRKGINLGEAAAALLLCKEKEGQPLPLDSIFVAGGSSSNDANHISGPSRTGDELAMAIRLAIEQAKIEVDDIDCISAHGTATIYNDEMEAKAFHTVGLSSTPLNSLKGYFGHTLGASGLLEIIISAESMRRNEWLPTKGFEELGVSQSLQLTNQLISRPLHTCLKTASGFGACNAAIILQKVS